jgi:hypothetical protein
MARHGSCSSRAPWRDRRSEIEAAFAAACESDARRTRNIRGAIAAANFAQVVSVRPDPLVEEIALPERWSTSATMSPDETLLTWSADGGRLVIATHPGARIWSVHRDSRTIEELEHLVATRVPFRLVDGRLEAIDRP